MITQQRKRKLRRRARREAARENVVDLGSARAAIGQANRDYARTAADARGAQKVQLSQLSQMLRGLGQSGLSGKYANQVRADLRSRKAEAVSGLPYALALANQERQDAIADARSTIQEQRIARQEAAGRKYNSLLEKARKNQAERKEDRAESQGISRGVKNALIVARNYAKEAAAKDGHVGITRLMKDPDKFAAFVAGETEGADPVDARRAVAILFRRFRRSAAKNAFENVYGPGSASPKKRR